MRYLGGKARVGRKIATFLNDINRGQPYWEPFVGACGVMQHVEAPRRYGSDACVPLIRMWEEAQHGWLPPEHVTPEDYAAAQRGEVPPHLQAFVGFGCSWAGKWFGGYARGKQHPSRRVTERNYAQNASRSVVKIAEKVREVQFFAADFFAAEPPEPGCLIYCDPPFAGTTGYARLPPFCPESFWERCRDLSRKGHTVAVSEYTAPPDWEPALVVRTKRAKRPGHGSAQSKRYVGDQVVGDNTDPEVDVESVYLRRED